MECKQQLRRSTVQFTAQTATHQRILFISACSMDEENKTEQNLIVRSGKSEAEVANNG